MSANKQHPEMLPGEVFINNCSEQSVHRIGWLTKRRGKTAYDVNGKTLPNTFPVFAQISELEKHLGEAAVLAMK